MSLGNVALHQGDYDRATALFDEAIARSRDLTDACRLVTSLFASNCGQTGEALLGDPPRADLFGQGQTLHAALFMAEELRLDSDALIQRVTDFARRLADHSSAMSRRMLEQGVTNPIVPRLADAVAARAVTCQSVLRMAWVSE